MTGHAQLPNSGDVWIERVTAVVDEAHAEDLGGEHRDGFCKACANAYLVAQRAVPRVHIERAAIAAELTHGGIYDELGQVSSILGTGHFDHREVGKRLDDARDALYERLTTALSTTNPPQEDR